MFETQNIKAYVQDVFPEVDGEKRLIKVRCYVNPITRELLSEVDEELARTLFHLVGKEWMPRPLLSHARFASNIGPHSLTYCRDPEFGNQHVFIPSVSITKLEAGKVTPESNDFAFMFTLSFEKHDPKVMNDLSDLLHEHFYITLAELQPGLFDGQDPMMDLKCRLCGMESPEFATTDNKLAYCAAHSSNIQDGEKLKRIRTATVPIDEPGRQPGEEPGPPRVDPLAEDINKRNQMGRRSSRRVN